MNEEIKSILRFENYIVKDIHFKYNMEYDQDMAIDIKFDMDAEYRIDECKGNMDVILKAYVFKEDNVKQYPFSMDIEVLGIFSITGSLKENVERFKPNAVAILFPYVRALISTYTANANVAPLILPPININRLLKSKDK
ncbi:hypothetical protein D7V86_13910 [bacterium D16-51]|nr:hypothetical protein D7V96_10955 [bacterium D16-59]RKI59102.1 hypothetical protein D7V86_13910 [bacterium D16-51]